MPDVRPVTHPGSLIHSIDHYVLDLRWDDRTSAYLSLYSVGYMPEVGAGTIAMVQLATDRHEVALCLAETEELGIRMQQRLDRVAPQDSITRAGVDAPVIVADFHRRPSVEPGAYAWALDGAGWEIEAEWRPGEDPFWVSASAGSFHPDRDYATAMLSYWDIGLKVNGIPVAGAPFEHERFSHLLGRRFSSCHVALAEVALEAP